MSTSPGAFDALPLNVVSNPKGLRELTSLSKRLLSGSASECSCPVSTAITLRKIDRASLSRMKTSAPGSSKERVAVVVGQSLKWVVTSQSPGWSRSIHHP